MIVSYDFKITKFTEKSINDTHKRIISIIKQVLDAQTVELSEIEVVTNEEKKWLLSLNNTQKYYQTGTS